MRALLMILGFMLTLASVAAMGHPRLTAEDYAVLALTTLAGAALFIATIALGERRSMS